jgi:hypothetical protein
MSSVTPKGNAMHLPRREFIRFASAAIAAPAVGISLARAEPAFRLIEKLNIKREEIQQTTNPKGAFFGENQEDHDGNQKGRSLLWRIRGGGASDIAWQLADVSVSIFRRPNPSVAPLEVTFRCTIWSRGYESLTNRGGGCFLDVVLLNKVGLVLNHLPLRLAGFDIRCQFRGNNLILPSLSYWPVDNSVFDDISHIQLFDRGGSVHPDAPYIRAFPCGGG